MNEYGKPDCSDCRYWLLVSQRLNLGHCEYYTKGERMTEKQKDEMPLAAWTLEISGNQTGCRVLELKVAGEVG